MYDFSFLNFIGFVITIIPQVYFLNHFLEPKYGIKRTSVFAAIWMLIPTFLMFTILFPYTALKPLLLIVCIYACSILFYRGSKIKRFATPFIVIGATLIIEIPIDFALFFIFGLDYASSLTKISFFFLQVFTNFMILLLCDFLAKLFSKSFNFSTGYSLIYLVMGIQFFVVVAYTSQMQMMYIYGETSLTRFFYTIIMLLVSIFTNIFMFVLLHRISQKAKLELSLERLKNEYRIQLDQYLDTKNEDLYRYLRHDIMNHLTHYQPNENDTGEAL